jgi:hypothetical protein
MADYSIEICTSTVINHVMERDISQHKTFVSGTARALKFTVFKCTDT